MCKPGEYSPNGLSPCNVCPQGKYSDKYQSKTCIACPSGTTTIATGTSSLYDCGSKVFFLQHKMFFMAKNLL